MSPGGTRYSSDKQRDASIADQLRLCRLHAEKQGWHVVEEYTDHAVSGASLLRPGIQALIADAGRGRFDLILAEAMDRLSRDQEDIAGLFKRMSFANVKIVTLSEGEVSHLHVGLKGTMNALFLKDLADKTRRGQRGRVEAGKSGGGNSYGYDVVRSLAADGEAICGDRAINEAEAEVVRRIFRAYAAGQSAKIIAVGGDLLVPDNLTTLLKPPYAPELNGAENIWEYLRENTSPTASTTDTSTSSTPAAALGMPSSLTPISSPPLPIDHG